MRWNWLLAMALLAGCTSPAASPDQAADEPAEPVTPTPAMEETPPETMQEPPVMRITKANGTAHKECDIRTPTTHLEVGCPNAPIGGQEVVLLFDVPDAAKGVLAEWRMVSGGRMAAAVDAGDGPPGHGGLHSANFEQGHSWYAELAGLGAPAALQFGIKAWSELGDETEAGILMDGAAEVHVTYFIGGLPTDPAAYCAFC